MSHVLKSSPGGGEEVLCVRQALTAVSIDGTLHVEGERASEQAVVLRDLLDESALRISQGEGPYELRLSKREGQLYFHFRDQHGQDCATCFVSLSILQTIVREYESLCRRYQYAVRTASLPRVETLDMGRRSLHNENAAFIQDKLAGAGIETDQETSRRLFTLMCTLQL